MMTIKMTGILVSLLILLEMTSKWPVDATEPQISHDHSRTSSHNYHHTRHHYHSAVVNQESSLRRGKVQNRPRVLHDSLRNARTLDDARVHRHSHDSQARDQVKDELNNVTSDQVSGGRAVAYGGHKNDQRFRSRDGFSGITGLTTLPPIYTKHHPG